jgi:cell wall-associated NlpC family hydrolase
MNLKTNMQHATSGFFYLMIMLCLLSGCAKVKVALYDDQQRNIMAGEAKEAYLETPSGKAYALRQELLSTAETYIGSPYRYGGTDPKKGFDCSGFVSTVASKHKITLPRSSSLMAKGAPHVPIKKAEPGDLVFFGDRGRIHHVGIIEKNKSNQLIVIHSTNQRGVIKENVLDSPYWKKRILYATSITSYPAKRA